MADSSLHGVEEACPASDHSFTENIADQGENLLPTGLGNECGPTFTSCL